jgi:hypothetical protein
MWTSLQITLLATATPLGPVHPHVPVRQIIVQNNSAGSIRIGASTVSATNGIYLAAGPGGGSFNSGVFIPYSTRLSDLYLFGTAGLIIDVFYCT